MSLRRILPLVSLTAGLMALLPAAQAATPAQARKAAAAKPAAPAAPAIPAATEAQVEAARLVHLGDSTCDDQHALQVQPSPTHPAYFDVGYRKTHFLMRPVLSSTGAVRLEDVKGQTLMLQIAYKSMLMDVGAGRRLADNCVHEVQAMAQRAAEQAAREAALAVQTPAGAGTPAPAAALGGAASALGLRP